MRSSAQRRRAANLLAGGFVVLVLIVLTTPMIILTVFSFNDSTIIALPFERFTFKWYAAALANRDVITSLGNSLLVAAIVTPLCVVLGTATAWGLTRYRFRGRGFLSGLLGAALVVPWLVIGISGLVFFAYFHVELTLFTVGAMHIAVTFPLITALVSARLVRFERSQDEAAIDLGASQLQLMMRVVLPQLAPTLAAAAIFGFAWSFNNFEISFFVGGYDQTFPVWVYAVLRRAYNLPVVNAAATFVSAIQILVVYLLWLGLRWVGKRRGESDGLVSLVTAGAR